MAVVIELGLKSHAVGERSSSSANVICQMSGWLKASITVLCSILEKQIRKQGLVFGPPRLDLSVLFSKEGSSMPH